MQQVNQCKQCLREGITLVTKSWKDIIALGADPKLHTCTDGKYYIDWCNEKNSLVSSLICQQCKDDIHTILNSIKNVDDARKEDDRINLIQSLSRPIPERGCNRCTKNAIIEEFKRVNQSQPPKIVSMVSFFSKLLLRYGIDDLDKYETIKSVPISTDNAIKTVSDLIVIQLHDFTNIDTYKAVTNIALLLGVLPRSCFGCSLTEKLFDIIPLLTGVKLNYSKKHCPNKIKEIDHYIKDYYHQICTSCIDPTGVNNKYLWTRSNPIECDFHGKLCEKYTKFIKRRQSAEAEIKRLTSLAKECKGCIDYLPTLSTDLIRTSDNYDDAEKLLSTTENIISMYNSRTSVNELPRRASRKTHSKSYLKCPLIQIPQIEYDLSDEKLRKLILTILPKYPKAIEKFISMGIPKLKETPTTIRASKIASAFASLDYEDAKNLYSQILDLDPVIISGCKECSVLLHKVSIALPLYEKCPALSRESIKSLHKLNKALQTRTSVDFDSNEFWLKFSPTFTKKNHTHKYLECILNQIVITDLHIIIKMQQQPHQ
jgi:hypothetical protein